jgi:glyoxylase-like metal-dependent hydrolase (beta-lactamase superfamily II)
MDIILQISPFFSHQYLVKGTSGYLLIDTGMSTNYAHLTNYLQANEITPSDLEMTIITHADGDHFGCLHKLMINSPGNVSCASQIEADAIRLGQSSRPMKAKGIRKLLFSMISPLFRAKPAEVNRILQPGDEFPYLGGLEVLDTRGHTPGHISLWSKTTRTLFSGDSIIIRGNVLSPSTGANTWNEDLAKQAFDLQLSLKPDRIYGGHGIWMR